VSPRIVELYAYVMADADEDDEGVPAFLDVGGRWMPMMGTDLERAEQLRATAEMLAALSGKPIKLVRSTGLELVDTIEPPAA
jgi:hypothetical protein